VPTSRGPGPGSNRGSRGGRQDPRIGPDLVEGAVQGQPDRPQVGDLAVPRRDLHEANRRVGLRRPRHEDPPRRRADLLLRRAGAIGPEGRRGHLEPELQGQDHIRRGGRRHELVVSKQVARDVLCLGADAEDVKAVPAGLVLVLRRGAAQVERDAPPGERVVLQCAEGRSGLKVCV
jgi:hypothetical protein